MRVNRGQCSSSCTSSQSLTRKLTSDQNLKRNVTRTRITFSQLQLLRASWTPQVGADVDVVRLYSGLLFQFIRHSINIIDAFTASPT